MVRIGTVVVIENQIALQVDKCSRILAEVASTWVEVVVAVASTQVATVGTQAAATTLAAVDTLATVGTLAIASQQLATSQVLVVARGISNLAQVEEARKLTAEYQVAHPTSEDDKAVQARICSNQSSNLDMLVTLMKDHPRNLVRTMVQKIFRLKLSSAACIRLKSTDIELMAACIRLKSTDIELMAACIRLKSTDIELMVATIEAQVIVMQAIKWMESVFA